MAKKTKKKTGAKRKSTPAKRERDHARAETRLASIREPLETLGAGLFERLGGRVVREVLVGVRCPGCGSKDRARPAPLPDRVTCLDAFHMQAMIASPGFRDRTGEAAAAPLDAPAGAFRIGGSPEEAALWLDVPCPVCRAPAMLPCRFDGDPPEAPAVHFRRVSISRRPFTEGARCPTCGLASATSETCVDRFHGPRCWRCGAHKIVGGVENAPNAPCSASVLIAGETLPHDYTPRAHLIGGKFQSDKYPTTPRGKFPLSLGDPDAQDLLWTYADRHRAREAELTDDLHDGLRLAGYTGRGIHADACGPIRASAAIAHCEAAIVELRNLAGADEHRSVLFRPSVVVGTVTTVERAESLASQDEDLIEDVADVRASGGLVAVPLGTWAKALALLACAQEHCPEELRAELYAACARGAGPIDPPPAPPSGEPS